ncbi:MAG: tripartite tricarboxylate transporter TctB family protein [Candidatus Rokuibacteriota bacterium]
MVRREAWSAGALAVLVVVAYIHSTRLDVGSVARPGPGFFPLVLTVALGVVAVALLLASTRRRHGDQRAGEEAGPASEGPGAEPIPRIRLGKLVATVGALAIYLALFERLGFILATIGFLAFLLGTLGAYRWPIAIAAGVLVALATYLVFDTWLQVRLPAGVLGRW